MDQLLTLIVLQLKSTVQSMLKSDLKAAREAQDRKWRENREDARKKELEIKK
jgi:hypothetical protein